jgi:hypothetical protein
MAEKKSDPMSYDLADWFYGQNVSRVFTFKEIGEVILRIREQHNRWTAKGKKVDMDEVQKWVSAARARLESTHGITLWNVRNHGFKLSNDREFAFYTMGRVSAAYAYILRANRLVPGMDDRRRKHLPDAVSHYFPSAVRGMLHSAQAGRNFIKGLLEFRNEQRKEVETKHGDNGN